jgi:hypothetical protein
MTTERTPESLEIRQCEFSRARHGVTCELPVRVALRSEKKTRPSENAHPGLWRVRARGVLQGGAGVGRSLMRGVDAHALSLRCKDLDAYPPEAKAREFWTRTIQALTPHDATALCIVAVDGRERAWLPLKKSDGRLLIVPGGE